MQEPNDVAVDRAARPNQPGVFVRSVYAERLSAFLRRRPEKAPKPSFVGDERAQIFFDAIDHRRVLSRAEEDALLSGLRGDDVALFRVAQYFIEQQKYGDAESLIEKVTSLETSQYLQAAIAADRRHLALTISHLHKTIRRNERVHKAWHALGLAYAAQGERDKALSSFYRAVRLTPSTESYFDELLAMLGYDDPRYSLITSLRQKAPQERSRWISPLDHLFSQTVGLGDKEVTTPSDHAGSDATELEDLPHLASIPIVLDTLKESDDVVVDIIIAPEQFLRSRDSQQRAQVAATLFAQATDKRERLHWLGSYAFAKAEQVPVEDRNHFLLVFLICSYYCNTDVPVRDVALRHYIKNAGSRALALDPLDAARAFVHSPPARSELWAARLAVALFDQLLRKSQLPSRTRDRLAVAFIAERDEPETAKAFVLETLFSLKLSSEQRHTIGTILGLLSRAYSLPQARDRVGSIFDLREYVGRQGAKSLPTDVLAVFETAIENLSKAVQKAIAGSPPMLTMSATLDVDAEENVLLRARYANEGNSELRDLKASVTLADGLLKKDIGYRESVASGEAAVFSTKLAGYAGGAELKVRIEAALGPSPSTNVQRSMVLQVPLGDRHVVELENPYYTGMPIPADDTEMFFGRKQELIQLTNLLSNRRVSHIPLVFGQRRTGKTSLLNRMSSEPSLKRDFSFCLIDCERASGQGTVGFVDYLRDELQFAFQISANAEVSIDSISADPLTALRTLLTSLVRQVRRGRGALIAFDEFETLLSGIRNKTVDGSILSVFRSFMQHGREIRFVIAGADELVERVREYASPLFGLARPIGIPYLDNSEIDDLIVKPIKQSVSVDADVIDAAVRLVAGHPHLTQLMCHYVIDSLNRTGRRRVTSFDIDQAAETIISENDAYFFEIYQGRCSLLDRQILAAAAELAQRSGLQVPYSELYQLLRECGIVLRPEYLQTLQDRQLVSFEASSRTTAFRLELFRRWIVRKYPLEAQRVAHV